MNDTRYVNTVGYLGSMSLSTEPLICYALTTGRRRRRRPFVYDKRDQTTITAFAANERNYISPGDAEVPTSYKRKLPVYLCTQ